MSDRIRCPACGLPVPDLPEDATYEEMLCEKCSSMKSYIVDDRTGEINQIGPFDAVDIYQAVSLLQNHEFCKFHNAGLMDVEIVDEVHAWIVINLPGGAIYEYEVGEIEGGE